MAIYHLHMQNIGKSGGRSAVAASAYRSASIITETKIDHETGIEVEYIHDYSKKIGVVYSEILTPEHYPSWAKDRSILWNKIQNEFDTRVNAVFAKDLDIALPKELDQIQNIELLKEFVMEAFVSEGMIADVNFHLDNEDNPHAHIMLTTREIIPDSDNAHDFTFGKKVRAWDTKEFLIITRSLLASITNDHLRIHGFDARINHMSFEDRGLDIRATIHEGPSSRHLGYSERVELNNAIKAERRNTIAKNPEKIIDELSVNRIVFTKSDIARELFKVMDVGEGVCFNANPYSNIIQTSSQNKGFDIEQASNNHISTKSNATTDHSANLSLSMERILSNKNLTLLLEKDFNGEKVYTSSKRIALEEDFVNLVREIRYNEHKAQTSKSDMLTTFVSDDKTIGEQIKERIAEKITEKIIELGKAITSQNEKPIILSDMQREAVTHVLDSHKIAILEGLPGTGKTTVMREIVEQLKNKGHRIIGTAISQAAAENLKEKAGIEAFNITKLRSIWDYKHFDLNLPMDYATNQEYKDKQIKSYNDRLLKLTDRARSLHIKAKEKDYQQYSLTSRDVLIVDEASMVDLTQAHYLISKVKEAGAKIILIGDAKQLSAVGTRGGFEYLKDQFGSYILSEVRRQDKDADREAIKLMNRAEFKQAINQFDQNKAFIFKPDKQDAINQMAIDYVREYLKIEKNNKQATKNQLGANKSQDRDNNKINSGKPSNNKQEQFEPKTITALAHSNSDVRCLNENIRIKLKESGVIRGDEYIFRASAGKITLAKHDKVIFTGNNKKLGVINGTRGEFIGIRTVKGGLLDQIKDNIIDKILEVQDKLKEASHKIIGSDNVQAQINQTNRENNTNQANHTNHINQANQLNKTTELFIFKVEGKEIEIDSQLYNSIDYGYATTIHKSQGKTYDNVLGLMSNQTGKSSFNVMMSRHKSEVRCYISEDDLNPHLNLNSRDAKLDSLANLLNKNQSNLLSIDYKELLISQSAKTLSAYMESAFEARDLKRHMDAWNKDAKLTEEGYSNPNPYKDQFFTAVQMRNNIAKEICNQQDQYKELIEYANISSKVLRIHAGLEKWDDHNINNINQLKGIRRVGDIRTSDLELYSFKTLLDKVVELGNIDKIKDAGANSDDKITNITQSNITKTQNQVYILASEVINNIDHQKEKIIDLAEEINDLKRNKSRDENFVESANLYFEQGFANILSNIYKDDPRVIEDKIHEMVANNKQADQHKQTDQTTKDTNQTAIDKTIQTIIKDPEAVGTIKGKSIAGFSITKENKQARGYLSDLPAKIDLYYDYKEHLPEVLHRIETKILDKEIALKQSTLNALREQLPFFIEEFAKDTREAILSNQDQQLKDLKLKATKVLKEINLYEKECEKDYEKRREIKQNDQATFINNSANKSQDPSQSPNQHQEQYQNYNQDQQNKIYASLKSNDYIKKREAILKEYEYSRRTDPESILYRKIAGSVNPDLAYNIVTKTSLYSINKEEGKAIIILNDQTISSKNKDQMANIIKQVSLSTNIHIAEIEFIDQDYIKEDIVKTEVKVRDKELFYGHDQNNVNAVKKKDQQKESLRYSSNICPIENGAATEYNSKIEVKVMARAEELFGEYHLIHGHFPSHQISAKLFKRAEYEEINREAIILYLRQDERYQNADGLVSPSQVLRIERDASGLKSMLGQKSFEGMAHSYMNITLRSIKELYFNKDKEVNLLITEIKSKDLNDLKDPSDLHNTNHTKDQSYTKSDRYYEYLAKQIIDYKLEYNIKNLADINPERIRILEEIAKFKDTHYDKIDKILGDKIIEFSKQQELAREESALKQNTYTNHDAINHDLQSHALSQATITATTTQAAIIESAITKELEHHTHAHTHNIDNANNQTGINQSSQMIDDRTRVLMIDHILDETSHHISKDLSLNKDIDHNMTNLMLDHHTTNTLNKFQTYQNQFIQDTKAMEAEQELAHVIEKEFEMGR